MADHLPDAGPLTLDLHGPLHQIPFETLISSDGQLLFERFDISVVPSISTLHHVRDRHRPPQVDDSFLALGSGKGLTNHW